MFVPIRMGWCRWMPSWLGSLLREPNLYREVIRVNGNAGYRSRFFLWFFFFVTNNYHSSLSKLQAVDIFKNRAVHVLLCGKTKRYFEFWSWFDIRTKCFNNGISCVVKMLVACQLFLEVFCRVYAWKNTEKNPAVLFILAGNSDHDLYSSI